MRGFSRNLLGKINAVEEHVLSGSEIVKSFKKPRNEPEGKPPSWALNVAGASHRAYLAFGHAAA